LPLVFVSVETNAFKVIMCGWVAPHGMRDVNSFADVRLLVTEWDGREPAPEAWNTTRIELESRAREVIEQMRARAKAVSTREREQQREAARLRVTDELGRLLVCSAANTDDLNGKFHRLASEATPTADRLKAVYNRLGGYPDWDSDHLADFRGFRDTLAPAQVKTRLTGRELDAALADPRWEVRV
jgi:hypothetical protein